MSIYRKSDIPAHLLEFFEPAEIGLESSPAEYVEQLVSVFRVVREVLADDGTVWLNLGDSYAGYHGNKNAGYHEAPSNKAGYFENQRTSTANRNGIKAKDLIGIPWAVAFALRDDGWYLRSDVIWHKPNPMPESITDRPTKAHEYVFLLTKSERYHYDAESILEPCSENTHARLSQNVQAQVGSARANGGAKQNGNMNAVARTVGVGSNARPRKAAPNGSGTKNNPSFDVAMAIMPTMRNKRSVWTIPTESFSGAHFATFPRALIEPCIVAGARPGGIVLDPFMGSGTTGQVATDLGRQFIGCELNPKYVEFHEMRRTTIGMMF